MWVTHASARPLSPRCAGRGAIAAPPPRAEPATRGGPRRGRGGPFQAAAAAARSRWRPTKAAPAAAAWAACAAPMRGRRRPRWPPGRRLAGAACTPLGTLQAGGARLTPSGAICGLVAAPGGPSRARQWPRVAPGPTGAPGTLLGRRYRRLHTWIRACAMHGKVRDFAEIVSRYVGITMTYAHASVLRDASGLCGVRGSVRRASYGHPELWPGSSTSMVEGEERGGAPEHAEN